MNGDQLNGTLGGTALSLAAVLDPDNLLKTIFLAAIGAIVSFLVSRLMKFIFKGLHDNSTVNKD